MASKKLTDLQRASKKVAKVLKSCLIQCSEKFKHENFRAPEQEEKIWLYTDACKLAMAELSQLEQLCLIDYYFCRGNKYIKESVDELVHTTLAGSVVSSNCPRSSKGAVPYIQVGSVYYHYSIEDLKEKALAITQPQVKMFMDELLANLKNKKDRLLNINNVYSSMHISSEMERKKFYQIEEGEQSASVTESYVSYKDFADLSHSLIRDSVLLELIKRCGELGCYKSEEQDGE